MTGATRATAKTGANGATGATGVNGATPRPEQAEGSDRKPRVRRPADLLLAVLALSGVALLFSVAHELPIGTGELTHNVAAWLTQHIPQALGFLVVSAIGLGCLAFAVVAVVTLLRTDVREARNAVVAFVVGTAIASACVIEWRGHRGGVATAMLQGRNATIFVVLVGFTAFVTGTDLARRPRWTRWCVLAVLLLPLSEVAVNDLTVFALLGAPLGGWAIGLLVRWVLAVSSVRPSPQALERWLRRSGVAVAGLADDADHEGFDGVLDDGTDVLVRLANRDTRGSGVARRLWRSVRLRGVQSGAGVFSSPHAAPEPGPRELHGGERGGARSSGAGPRRAAPRDVGAGAGLSRGGDARRRDCARAAGRSLAALRSLHTAGVADRDLREENLLVGAHGAGFASLGRDTNRRGGACPTPRSRPGTDDVGDAGRCSTGGPGVPRGLPPRRRPGRCVRPPTTRASPWGWSAMRQARGCLTEVRREFVGPEDEIAPLRLERFRWRTVISAIGMTVAAFLLSGSSPRSTSSGRSGP